MRFKCADFKVPVSTRVVIENLAYPIVGSIQSLDKDVIAHFVVGFSCRFQCSCHCRHSIERNSLRSAFRKCVCAVCFVLCVGYGGANIRVRRSGRIVSVHRSARFSADVCRGKVDSAFSVGGFFIPLDTRYDTAARDTFDLFVDFIDCALHILRRNTRRRAAVLDNFRLCFGMD